MPAVHSLSEPAMTIPIKRRPTRADSVGMNADSMWRSRMDWKTLSFLLVILMFSFGNAAMGQHGGSASSGAPPEGWETGGYQIHQSIELGYRASDVTGSQAMYDTLIDLRSGPRIFEQSL